MPRVSGRFALVAVVGAAVLSFNFGSRLLLTNATTDLRELRAVVAQAPAPLSALDLQDLALSFNLDRPVVNTKDYQRFEARARQGNPGYLIISDRALATQPAAPCMRRVARGVVTRQPFTVLDPRGCVEGTSPPEGAKRE